MVGSEVHVIWENEWLIDLESELFTIHHAMDQSSGEPLFGYGAQENSYNLADKEADLEDLRQKLEEQNLSSDDEKEPEMSPGDGGEPGSNDRDAATESFTTTAHYLDAFLRAPNGAASAEESSIEVLAQLPDILDRQLTTAPVATIDVLNTHIRSKWPAFVPYRQRDRIDDRVLVAALLLVADRYHLFADMSRDQRAELTEKLQQRFRAFVLHHSPEQLMLLLNERRKIGPCLRMDENCQESSLQHFTKTGLRSVLRWKRILARTNA